ncbi:hypothetical protein [Streptomyces sp. NPDC058441]|uniref:hypothetical protein n=1 Tax=Streptomyces sp. NPDC058441 TaxID=3346502 RepID=UPI003662A57C
MSEITGARYVGRDPVTGRGIYIQAEPGGALEAVADTATLKAAAALNAIVSAVIESNPTDAEAAAFLPAISEALGDTLEVAARAVDRLDEPAYGSAARTLGDVLRVSR